MGKKACGYMSVNITRPSLGDQGRDRLRQGLWFRDALVRQVRRFVWCVVMLFAVPLDGTGSCTAVSQICGIHTACRFEQA